MALTVLIADDDRIFSGELRRLLECGRMVVLEARNGEEAVRLTHECQPDVVLMDMVMPRMSGLEATRRIKMARPHTKVIMLTVHDETQYRKAAVDSGADRFFLKKVLGAELIPAIATLMPGFAAGGVGECHTT
jgi:two-component system response regulator DegU